MSKSLNGIVKAWEAKLKKSQAAAKRRANSIFNAMSVAHVDDEEITEVFHVEKVFPNGDIYTGDWGGKYPHGHGKHLWKDGCMYEGDWYGGKPMGKGKFSWPSGATYEGQFKNGYMDGEGLYTGSSESTYKGGWVCNLRHGKGVQSYENGDQYEGHWRHGLPDGKGRYQWHDGNQYIGHWRRGRMTGSGMMLWSNGNRYEGGWENGVPRGKGTFKWGDGSFYAGVWSEDPREQSGTYYPSNSQSLSFDWDLKQVYISCCKIGTCDDISILPSEKSVSWQCDLNKQQSTGKKHRHNDARLRRMSIDGGGVTTSTGSESEFSYDGSVGDTGSQQEGDAGLGAEDFDASQGYLHPPHMTVKPTKKQGITISKGHKNYELMLNLQLGIRHSVGRPAPAISLDLKASDFDPKEKIWTRFPSEGSKHTPPHQSCEFKWKDYCPVVFRTLRKLFKVDPADYMISICGNDALRELSSPGKSGSFFYLTNDDKYMIKTMKKAETKVLIRMLSAYYNHVRAFENTLVTKFFGLHCVKLAGPAQKKVRFVIMGNLFCTEYAIHRRFDLKGSSLGRLTVKPESEIEPTTTLKDLDLNFIFRLHEFWFQKFSSQVDRDCEFLEQERIMDYSLLVGIHFRDVSLNSEALNTEAAASTSGISPSHPPSSFSTSTNLPTTSYTGKAPQVSALLSTAPSKGDGSFTLGSNLPARADLAIRRNTTGEPQLVGEPTGEYYDVFLVFGIIDILQDYDIGKKLEHAYKSFQHDPTLISAVDPRQYSKRFRDFILKVFIQDN